MKFSKTGIFISLTLLVTGCASTRITSFKDPDYINPEFKRVLILAETDDLQEKQALESRMAEAFADAGISGTEGYRIFPPTRDLTKEEESALLESNKIDAQLTIIVLGKGVKKKYVPERSETVKVEGSVEYDEDETRYEEKTTTKYEGGYTTEYPWAKYETKLYDVSNGRVAWIADTFTEVNYYPDESVIIKSYCNNIVERLLEDRVVFKREK